MTDLVGYASRTGTKRSLAALREAGWRLLVSAKGVLRTEGFDYALDNGAWTAHQKGEPFDVPAFEKAVEALGTGADWIVAPDNRRRRARVAADVGVVAAEAGTDRSGPHCGAGWHGTL